ncbi:hypothetical protein FLAN108750_00445 [Flavobacterium antarcticum]
MGAKVRKFYKIGNHYVGTHRIFVSLIMLFVYLVFTVFYFQ